LSQTDLLIIARCVYEYISVAF